MPDPTHIEQPPEPEPALPTLAVQLDAIAALRALADAFPHLPAVHITVYEPGPGWPATVTLQIRSQVGFELWREALQISPEAVGLWTDGESSWLKAHGAFCGASVEISTHQLPPVGPRDGSEPDAPEAPTGGAA